MPAGEGAGAAGFGQTWATFCALERTLGPSPGALEGWRRGRARYALWALRIADADVAGRMAVVAAPLAGAIVPVAPHDAHVTAWVCGFPAAAPAFDDDVAEEVLAAQRAAIARLAPPRLTIAAPNAFATCAFLEVHDPHGDLTALRAALTVPGAREVRFARYQPHVTVGRFKDTRPAAPIAATLRTLRASDRFAARPIRACAIELIELDARRPDQMTTRR